MKERIKRIITNIQEGIFEKDQEIALSLLAALAGESVLLLGPPGVAKSMVARRLKLAFKDGKGFEYLMSRFSTPDEIFGPVSITKLRENDVYERSVEGYLPTADVVFLDEIWKAGPAIQNSLLTVINEKLFRNGKTETRLPLKLLVAASNELPAKGEGLEALWDRFIIRLECSNIENEQSFIRMLSDHTCQPTVKETDCISSEEYLQWTKEIDKVVLSDETLRAICSLRKSLRTVRLSSTGERRNIYISDRRWKNIARLLRTSAFVQDRNETTLADLLPIYHCLWQEPEERDAVRQLVMQTVIAPQAEVLAQLKEDLQEEIKQAKIKRVHGKLTDRQLKRDSDKRVYNQFYYHLEGHGSGNTYIMTSDFKQLPVGLDKNSVEGILYNDRKQPSVSIIRSYDSSMGAPVGSMPITLKRDNDAVYIDGTRYMIEKNSDAANNEDLPLFNTATKENDNRNPQDEERDFAKEIDEIADRLNAMKTQIVDNIFASEEDKKQMNAQMSAFFKELAFTRQDIGKLYD
ncbi:MAG: AAA family ATPase [Prevotella sp.]|jgi:MoxR-like ATPase